MNHYLYRTHITPLVFMLCWTLQNVDFRCEWTAISLNSHSSQLSQILLLWLKIEEMRQLIEEIYFYSIR